jgi:hypothetical protein
MRYVVAFALGWALGAVICLGLPAHAATASKMSLIGSADLARLDTGGHNYASAFPWIACGLGQLPCQPGQAHVYTSWASLSRDIRNKTLKAGMTVLEDNEKWRLTPLREQARQPYYIRREVSAAHAAGLKIILTVNFGSATIDKAYLADAAGDGADTVSMQLQGADNNPASYLSHTRADVNAIRARSRTVHIWDGLSTDAGGVPAKASNLIASWRKTWRLVNGFWLNVPIWHRGTGCELQGCPLIGQAFLAGIGVTG